jgi:glycosyltransferase involved in cell wall biosynthesis
MVFKMASSVELNRTMSMENSVSLNPAQTTAPMVWHIGGEDVRMRIPLLLALRDRGFQVGAVGSEDGAVFALHEIPYWRYSLDRGINPWADIQTRRELKQLLEQHRPDVIHGFDTKPALFAPIVGQQVGIRGRVRTITGMGYVFSSQSLLARSLQPIYRYLQQKTSIDTDITVFQNGDDRDYFRQNKMVEADRDALVLGSGIDIEDLRRNCPPPEQLQSLRQELGLEDQVVVTMVARLVKSKGVLEYLKAAKRVCEVLSQQQLSQQQERVKFLLVGPLESEGKQAISRQDLHEYQSYVQYLGPRRDIPAILQLTDIFALPSYYREGVPRVLLEAGMMKLPLVTTDMPGCREVVRDGWNGRLVAPRDDEALATAIADLVRSPEQRSIMGNHSESHVKEHFSLNQVADAYATIYHRILAS